MSSRDSDLRASEQRELAVTLLVMAVAAFVQFQFDVLGRAYALAGERVDSFAADALSSLIVAIMALAFLTARRSIQLRTEVQRRLDAEERAHSLSLHDPLTGLPNRRRFTDELKEAILRTRREGSAAAVLMIDLDRFKPINDTYGHAVGDAVLAEVASRLKASLHDADCVARIGGDEFAMVVAFDGSPEGLSPLAESVIIRVSQPITAGDNQVRLGATIGIALCPADGQDADALLQAADAAMYRAKRLGRSSHCFYETGMDDELRERAALEQDLRSAIANREIRPHFQPLVSLEQQQLLGFEVLARWYHPTKGIVMPNAFIPVAEETGLISELSYQLLEAACREAGSWPSELYLSFNLSPRQLVERDLPRLVLAALESVGFPPQRLTIEITESALVSDLASAKAILAELQAAGIKIALDDFGTGYSSLYHLRELNFDAIKIDASFVRSLHGDKESQKIVSAVINLGKSLDLPTTAEGIETDADLHKLRELGCEFGQGYHFGKALSGLETDRLIRDQQAKERVAA